MSMDAAKNTPGLPQARLQVPKPTAAELGPWVGGALAWGAMTYGVTHQARPALISTAVVTASSVARLYARDAYPAHGNDALVIGSGTIVGSSMGAAVGACVTSGIKDAARGAMMRSTVRGMGVGAVIGTALGVAQAKYDTFLM